MLLFTMLRSAKKVFTRMVTSRMLTTGHNYVVKHAEDADNMKLAALFSGTHDAHMTDVGEEYSAIRYKRSCPEYYSFFIAKNPNEHMLGAIELMPKVNSANDVFWNRSRNPKWSVNEMSQNDALIGRMAVVPSADVEGVGYRLIERAVQHSHENLARRIFAHVGASNDASRRALELAGFEVVTSDKWMGNIVYLYGKKLSKVSEDIKYVVQPADASDNMKIASLIVNVFVNDALIENDITVDQEYYSILDKRTSPEYYAFFVAKANQYMESTMLGAIELMMKVNATEDVFHDRPCSPKWAISETSRKDAIIDKLVVVRSARGGGVGFSLIERAIQHAHENGAHRIFALVGEFNVAIRGALDKAGFQVVSYDRWKGNLEYVYGKQLKESC